MYAIYTSACTCIHMCVPDSAIDECYTEVNTRGIAHGHCGYDKTDYFPCSAKYVHNYIYCVFTIYGTLIYTCACTVNNRHIG